VYKNHAKIASRAQFLPLPDLPDEKAFHSDIRKKKKNESHKSELPTDSIPQSDSEHGTEGSGEDLQTEKPLDLARTFVHGCEG
jgi:hypothetical protein